MQEMKDSLQNMIIFWFKVEDYWKKKLAEIFEHYFDDYLPPAYHKN